jgi:hypothetical protein
MSETKIEAAAQQLANEIVELMAGLREAVEPGAHVYVVALVVLDDFSDLQIYANTDQHLAESGGTDTDRWYFGQFWSEGMPVDFDALTEQLGEVEDAEEQPEQGNAVDWLLAMTHAMRRARTQGAFNFDGKEATVYCSMVDSLNAIWLEDLSAKFLNDPDTYAAAAPGIKAASSDWYQSDGEEDSSAFRLAFQSQLPA